jgi:formate--tetrahydrofolate ligase
MPPDIQIARSVVPRPVEDVATDMGIPSNRVARWGRDVAKVSLEAIDEMGPPRAKYVLVTATTPTPFGEGKTTVSLGLGQAFKHIGRNAVVTLRQPSLGPTFGIKGGAAGGGYAQVIPLETMNLHLSGDFHAVSAAHNLLAAMVDNSLYHGNKLGLKLHDVSWRRVVDMNDRALRHIIIGLGRAVDGIPRESAFDITSASEIMAVLGLSTGIDDLRERLGRLVVGYTYDKEPVTANDIGAAGAMTVLLQDALMPNIMQTLEQTPVVVHTGPFANIAHGNCSVLADQVAVRAAEYVITEAGFGADIGAEKFFNIKSRASGLKPDAAVIVTTVRALKMHSGGHTVRAGRPLPESMLQERPDEVTAGAENLRRHIHIVRRHGVNPVVAINAFPTDFSSEHEAIAKVCDQEGVRWAVSRQYTDGGPGTVELAEMVVEACDEENDFRLLYPDDMPLVEKIDTIATEVYGADGVEYEPAAKRQLARFEDLGWRHLPICMVKTHRSLSHDIKLLNAPTGWMLPIREVRASVGAGFILPLAGDISTMPGLSSSPSALGIDIDADGNIVGLS